MPLRNDQVFKKTVVKKTAKKSSRTDGQIVHISRKTIIDKNLLQKREFINKFMFLGGT